MNKLVANELLPIYQTTDTGEHVVDARELCGFLNVGRDFTTWLKDRIEKYGFIEGEDYSPVSGNIHESRGKPRTDYILKLDMAKELAMVENNEQGRKARRYFIEVEKRFRNDLPAKVPLANMEHERLTKLIQMLRMAERERLFTPDTERALRKEIAELVLGYPIVEAKPTAVDHRAIPELPPRDQQPEPSANYTGKWYTTKEIAKLAKVTVHLISSLSSQHDLRTDAYSRLQSNRTNERSTGLTWLEYNERGKQLLMQYAAARIAAGYQPRKGQKWGAKR